MSASSLLKAPHDDPQAWSRRFVVLGLLTAITCSSAPIPLYPIFRQELQLDASTMTLIFVIYVLGALTSLLTMGQLVTRLASPYRLLGPALLIAALGAVLMANATAIETLLAGRLLAGLATGGVTVAANILLVELSPPNNPQHGAMLSSLSFGTGSALGPILTGLLLELDLWPLVLPFALIALSALVASQTPFRHWNSHRKNQPTTPQSHSTTADNTAIPWAGFVLCAATIVAVWSMGSTAMALGPFFGDTIFGYSNYAFSGFLVAGYLVATTVSQWLYRSHSLHIGFLHGGLMAVGGLLLLLLAVHQQILWLTLPGLLIAALGHGAAFGAAAGQVVQTAPPRHRAKLVSWFYTAGYLSNLIPLSVGVLVDHTNSVFALDTYILVNSTLLLLVVFFSRRLSPRR